MKTFPGRLAVQQRVLPAYRVPFFDLLAESCEGGLSLFAGEPRAKESIVSGEPRIALHSRAHNVHILSGSLYFCYQKGTLDWLADWDPDKLIMEANPRYLATRGAVRWMHTRGRRVLGWGLGSPSIDGPMAGVLRKRWLSFLRQFDGLMAYSQRGAEEYAALGFPREHIFVAHNSVSPAPKEAAPARSETKQALTLLFVGRLQARKRVDLLLRACAQLERKPRLVIVGDGPERARLEALAAQIYPAAEFVGEKHGEELEPFFRMADLFVLPGTGGLAVQEAMSHALPVIVAQGDGTQDDLVRRGNGWQIAPGRLEALVRVLREATGDRSRLRTMGSESYRIVAQEINLEKMVEAFVRALNESAQPPESEQEADAS